MTMPPAENPIMPTLLGRYPNSPARSRTSRTAWRPSSAASLITAWTAGPPWTAGLVDEPILQNEGVDAHRA